MAEGLNHKIHYVQVVSIDTFISLNGINERSMSALMQMVSTDQQKPSAPWELAKTPEEKIEAYVKHAPGCYVSDIQSTLGIPKVDVLRAIKQNRYLETERDGARFRVHYTRKEEKFSDIIHRENTASDLWMNYASERSNHMSTPLSILGWTPIHMDARDAYLTCLSEEKMSKVPTPQRVKKIDDYARFRDVVLQHPQGISGGDIAKMLGWSMPRFGKAKTGITEDKEIESVRGETISSTVYRPATF